MLPYFEGILVLTPRFTERAWRHLAKSSQQLIIMTVGHGIIYLRLPAAVWVTAAVSVASLESWNSNLPKQNDFAENFG